MTSPPRPGAPGRPAVHDTAVLRRRLDASLSLLNEHVVQSLDAGYAEAAERRRRTGKRHRTPASLAVVLAVCVLAGLLLAVAANQQRARAETSGTVRAALLAEVEERTAANAALEAQLDLLRADIAATRDALLREGGGGAVGETPDDLARLETATGTAPVVGAGVVVTVDDARIVSDPEADPTSEEVETGRVRDSDLQSVVNALWASGAEAVAINGQRLTNLSAIRNASIAVLVAYRPLAPPYVVEAVGDPERLREGFAEHPDGQELLAALGNRYGIRFDVSRADELRLPAASGVVLRTATPLTGSGPAGDTGSTGGRGPDDGGEGGDR